MLRQRVGPTNPRKLIGGGGSEGRSGGSLVLLPENSTNRAVSQRIPEEASNHKIMCPKRSSSLQMINAKMER